MNTLRDFLKTVRIKLGHWEYWNSALVYFPLMPYLLFLMIKSRNFFFFNAANPGIAYGGFTMESKWDIYQDAPDGFFPKTLLIDPKEIFDRVEEHVRADFPYPFVLKPDIGGKGKAVVMIKNKIAFQEYHHKAPLPYLIQEKINYPLEIGLFYVRHPHEANGKITGIVQKTFVELIGDGQSTLGELIHANPRYFLQRKALRQQVTELEWNMVLPQGEKKLILEIGNHARGSMFTDASHQITPALTAAMDAFCKQFDGFYFGRLDIRFASWEGLARGEDFGLIELNGSGSEPTHIYDPKHSLWFAWKEIARHWKLMQAIASANQKQGTKYLTTQQGIRLLLDHQRVEKILQRV